MRGGRARRRGAPGFALGIVVTGARELRIPIIKFYIELKPTAVQLHVGTRARQTSDSTLETVTAQLRVAVGAEPSMGASRMEPARSSHRIHDHPTISVSTEVTHSTQWTMVCAERTQSSNDVDDTLDSSGRAAGR